MASTAQNEPAHTTFAKENFSKSGASGLYDRARPSYPPESISHILSALPTPSTPTDRAVVVELGSGTGIFTRALLSHPDTRGKVKKVICVEPSEGMREGFGRATLSGAFGWAGKGEGAGGGGVEVECVNGTFEDVPVEDGSVDLVVCAQAFHWTGSNPLPAVRSIARLLRPSSPWALIWNLEDRSVPWIAQLRDAYEQFEVGPQYRLNLWKKMWDDKAYWEVFGDVEQREFRWVKGVTEQGAVDRVFSKSYITALSDNERAKLETKLREVIRRGEGKKWMDEKAGTFEYDYTTDLFIARRK
ncbi:methyltransferase type 11 [Rhodotorula toruloides]|uniref:Methyltransferase type 11 n=1 Tax=Rhodotorula toruloides TaxID=5286 RepID=A0A511KCT1_RHOTO|nr:methyltransferase type 11 [Rhodotorula toruloides]